MDSKKLSVISGAKAHNSLAQRGPVKASDRPLRVGPLATGGAGGGPRGAARALLLYYLFRTPSRLKGVKKVVNKW